MGAAGDVLEEVAESSGPRGHRLEGGISPLGWGGALGAWGPGGVPMMGEKMGETPSSLELLPQGRASRGD